MKRPRIVLLSSDRQALPTTRRKERVRESQGSEPPLTVTAGGGGAGGPEEYDSNKRCFPLHLCIYSLYGTDN
jgi:hypothetical protein